MPSIAQEFIDNINQKIFDSQPKSKRHYVGASSIGDPCKRKLQYQFRHCVEPNFTASTLKKFEDGHNSESIYIQRIKDAGYELQHDDNGVQYGFSELGGWFSGHRDGYLFKLPFLNDEDAIWEHKSSAKWKQLSKLVEEDEFSALEKWNNTYFVQAQLYMHYSNTKWHVLTCASEGSRDESIVVTKYQEEVAQKAINDARNIIASDSLLPRISENPDFYLCKMCDAKDTCFNRKLPKPSCRNCAALNFELDGDKKATCTMHGFTFEGDPKALENTYDCHLYIPELIHPDALKEAMVSQTEHGLKYNINNKEWTNGRTEKSYLSSWLYENGFDMIESETVNEIAKQFDAKVVSQEFKQNQELKPFSM